MQGFSFDNGVAMICGAACVVTAVFCLLSFVALLGSRSPDTTAERAAAFVVSLIALALSLAVLWTTAAVPAGAVPAYWLRWLNSTGIPPMIFQVQAAIALAVIAFLAWRFPNR